MKYIWTTIAVAFVLQASAQRHLEEKKVLAVLENQQTAWNNGNINGFMLGYIKTDSLLFVGASEPTYGWQKTLENYKKSYPDKKAMGTLTFDIKKINLLSKDAAFVLGSWALKREADKPHGYFTLIFRKIDGEWKIAVDHTSSSKN